MDNTGEKTLLTSIHESSDSNKSDKSEEGSDSEKKDFDKESSKVTVPNKGEPNDTKEEIKIEKPPSPSSNQKEGWSPLQDLPSPVLNVTMPLPQDPRIIPQLPHPQYFSYSPATNFGRIECFDPAYKYSDCSLDYDNTSEGYYKILIL